MIVLGEDEPRWSEGVSWLMMIENGQHHPRRPVPGSRHAHPGEPVSVDQDVVVGDVTHPVVAPASCPAATPPPRAGGEGGGGVIPRHHRSKAGVLGRIRHRHDSAMQIRAVNIGYGPVSALSSPMVSQHCASPLVRG
jgi:hypothetical protein